LNLTIQIWPLRTKPY